MSIKSPSLVEYTKIFFVQKKLYTHQTNSQFFHKNKNKFPWKQPIHFIKKKFYVVYALFFQIEMLRKQCSGSGVMFSNGWK